MKRLVNRKFYDNLVDYVEHSADKFDSRGDRALNYTSAEFLLKHFDELYEIMEIVKVPVVNKSNNDLPAYADNGFNSGCDIKADLWEIQEKFLFNSEIVRNENNITCIRINPGGRALIPSGLHVAIPEGYEIQVRPRSGLALKHGVSCTNTPGTIDSSYRGDIGIILENRGRNPFEVYQGDKIAQLVLQKVPLIEWIPVESLDETERGEGGFGHTGK